MSVPEFVSDLAEPDPGIAAYAAIDTDGDAVAAMRAWTGIPTLFEDEEDYQTIVAHRMIEMTQNINENWDAHVNANGEVGVTCFTCHRGQAVPSGVWYNITPVNQSMAGWSSTQNMATSQSQYTSLPSDALQSYLADYEPIGVHDLDSRVPGVPGQDVAAIQNAERTYSLMNYFANSLGVNCVFCHNSRAFYDAAQVTPQWATASLGIAMVQELNLDYLIPLEEVLPPETPWSGSRRCAQTGLYDMPQGVSAAIARHQRHCRLARSCNNRCVSSGLGPLPTAQSFFGSAGNRNRKPGSNPHLPTPPGAGYRRRIHMFPECGAASSGRNE